MNLTPVLDLLRQRIGLDAESLGPNAVARVVSARMHALGLSRVSEYAARLTHEGDEFRVLMEELAVPETWFFRGGEVFAFLARRALETVRARGAGGTFRVLSIPCSTGEEPYSVAMAFAEAGLPFAAWAIEGVDLSTRHLEIARRARFMDFSFRQTPAELRQRYFQAVDGRWELDAAVRSRVRFRQGNLLDPLFLAGEASFDVIFCRNLFIYLHDNARRSALTTLERLLLPDGLLCMGHAEPLDGLDRRFVRTESNELFLYRRAPVPPRPQFGEAEGGAREPRVRKAPPPRPTSSPSSAEARGLPNRAAAPQPAPAKPSLPASLISLARQQADAGKMDEALSTCETQLARSGPSADVFALQGVLYQARGERARAAECYQRALYLEPRHVEALTHLALLVREQGDHAQAERLRQRLARLSSGGKP